MARINNQCSAMLARANDRRIPDSGLKRIELILRILLEHPDGAIPGHFLVAPGGYEFSARIAELESIGFTIDRADVPGKRFKRYILKLPAAAGQLQLI